MFRIWDSAGSGRDFRAGVRQSALTLTGVVRTPDDDGYILVRPASAALDLGAEITCDLRNGDGG